MIAPIYKSERAEVYCADARDVLPTLVTESFDLLVTDPPYGQEWQSNRRAESFDVLDGDSLDDRDGIQAVLRDAVRLVGQSRHVYVFGPPAILAGGGIKVSEVVALVWDKGVMGSGDLSAAWGPAHEPISFAVSKHRHGGQVGNGSLPTRARKGTVLRFSRPTGRKVRHPSEKPVALLTELIESSSRVGQIVLDPFAGIGSTGVAAILAGRRTLLVELKSEYAEIAVERVRAAEDLAVKAEAL